MPKPNPTGKKTHGRWVDKDGNIGQMVSGEDEDAIEVRRILKAAGVPPVGEPVTVTHVEMKLAARMRRQRERHMELVVNNEPCVGPYGCDTLLPALLPQGYSITIHGPRESKTYAGGEEW